MFQVRNATDLSCPAIDTPGEAGPALLPLKPQTPRGEATRQRLLHAAEAEFAAKGFHIASVSSVTTLAGVGQGTFYLYFRTKDEIFATLVDDIAQRLIGHLKQVEPTANAVLDALLDFAAEQPGAYRILQEAQFIDGAAFVSAQRALVKALGKQLGLPTESALGWALLGLGQGLCLRGALSGDERQTARETIDALLQLASPISG